MCLVLLRSPSLLSHSTPVQVVVVSGVAQQERAQHVSILAIVIDFTSCPLLGQPLSPPSSSAEQLSSVCDARSHSGANRRPQPFSIASTSDFFSSNYFNELRRILTRLSLTRIQSCARKTITLDAASSFPEDKKRLQGAPVNAPFISCPLDQVYLRVHPRVADSTVVATARVTTTSVLHFTHRAIPFSHLLLLFLSFRPGPFDPQWNGCTHTHE